MAVYLGNPNAHTIAGALYVPTGLGHWAPAMCSPPAHWTRCPNTSRADICTAPVGVHLPDVDRTDYLVVMGANPLVSNGSLATAADFGGKLKALRPRGGRLIVIDPNRTRTAARRPADPPRPGTDGALLFAMVNVLFDEDLVDLGGLADIAGVEQVRAAAAEFPPEAVAEHCGVAPTNPRPGPRNRGGAKRRGLRPHRHLHVSSARSPAGWSMW